MKFNAPEKFYISLPDFPDQSGRPLNALVTLETDEDGWIVASCPALQGCYSQGGTKSEALTNIKEAIEGYLISMAEQGESSPPL